MSAVNEEWRPVQGYEGKYSVSSRGRVRSEERVVTHSRGTLTVRERLMQQQMNHAGYLVVGLRSDGKRKLFRVHRIVAQAFHGDPLPNQVVDHIDSDRSNNCAENLRWCDCSENTRFAIEAWKNSGGERGLNARGESHGMSKLTSDEVLSIRKRNAAGETQSAIASELGVSQSQVSNVVRGRSWGHAPGRIVIDRVHNPSRVLGEENGSSKLTDTDVVSIRIRRASGETQKAIADHFGVDPSLISLIVRGKLWKHLPTGLLHG